MEGGRQLEQLKQIALRAVEKWNPKLAETLTNRPELLEQLLESGIKAIGEELRISLIGISQQAEGPLRELVDRLNQELDREEVINAIARPLTTTIATWLQEDDEAREALVTEVANQFMQKLDLNAFAHEVATQVAEKLGQDAEIRIASSSQRSSQHYRE